MARQVTLKHIRKAGAFLGGELAAGEWGLDVTNNVWYYSTNGTTVNTLPTGGGSVAALNDVGDVTITTPGDNNLLSYDAGTLKWINQTPAAAGVLAVTDRGAANGVASLDGAGKIPTAQIPDTVLGAVDYVGAWDAALNSPAIGGATPTVTPAKGDYYVVSVAGTTSLGGITDWQVGDWAIYNGAAWQKVDNTDLVASVFGRTGAVVAAAGDYAASQVTNDSAVAGTGVSGALNTLNTGKAAATHTHDAADIATGNLAAARMQGNLVAALNASAGGTVTNGALILDAGTL